MAVQRKLQVSMETVFPAGAFLVGEVEPVMDFQAPQRADGSRPQQMDKESGLPMWQVAVLDADPEAANREKTVVVKLIARHQPVPPANKTGMPFTPVRLAGLTLTPWVDDNGQRPRISWSIRATGFEDDAPQGKAA